VADFIGSVNLFEGVLAVDEPSHAVVRSPDLDCDIFLDHGVTGARGGTVWAAICGPRRSSCTSVPTAAPRPTWATARWARTPWPG
jgi:hypothetical protein